MNDDRPCTCPPMERPHPCARKFALTECKAATILDPVCYRWRHQKDEVWKYGHQPQHLIPPRGKELIGYYIVQPLYSEDALRQARNDALGQAEKVVSATRYEVETDVWDEGFNAAVRACADAIRALKKDPRQEALGRMADNARELGLDYGSDTN